MNSKEYAEIRRRLNPEKNNIDMIRGCYVNEKREIVTTFSHSLLTLPQGEAEKYLSIFRKTITGTPGKNLIDITFKTSQVANSPEHKLLMDLRESKLQDDELRQSFYQKIIDSIVLEGNYLILLGCDTYDVPFKSKDDFQQNDSSDESYTYLICAVCPVKQTKPNLHYVPEEKTFHDGAMNQPVAAPEVGFLFPAFDNRSTNIYNALYYTRNTKENQDGLIEALFNTPVPKPAAEQKKCFEALLTTSLGDECSMDVVQTVHEQLCERMELHKESKVPEPLLIDKEVLKDVLTSCGVSEAGVATFSVQYDEAFGFEAELHPKNIIDSKHFEIHTPDIAIKIDPSRTDLVETRVIGGVKYIMINADEDVEVNGVSIHFQGDAEKAPATV